MIAVARSGIAVHVWWKYVAAVRWNLAFHAISVRVAFSVVRSARRVQFRGFNAGVAHATLLDALALNGTSETIRVEFALDAISVFIAEPVQSTGRSFLCLLNARSVDTRLFRALAIDVASRAVGVRLAFRAVSGFARSVEPAFPGIFGNFDADVATADHVDASALKLAIRTIAVLGAFDASASIIALTDPPVSANGSRIRISDAANVRIASACETFGRCGERRHDAAVGIRQASVRTGAKLLVGIERGSREISTANGIVATDVVDCSGV